MGATVAGLGDKPRARFRVVSVMTQLKNAKEKNVTSRERGFVIKVGGTPSAGITESELIASHSPSLLVA